MKRLKLVLVSLALVVLVWAIMSWPLPRYAASGIPASAQNVERGNIRTMIPGDHLQFLYHLWLARDTFFGPTPLFSNLYEFNTGDDEARAGTARHYYLPFSLFYSLGSAAGGRAFGWNFTGFVSLWISLVFTWLLLQRFGARPGTAAILGAVGILLPYRWITLLGGSPTGLSMMWIPVAFYGLDVMVRDRKAWGGAVAGLAVYFSGWSDPHVMFFAALGAPCWCVLSHLNSGNRLLPQKDEWSRLLIAAVPLVIFAVLVIFQARGVKEGLSDAKIADQARELAEIGIYSPDPEGFVTDRHGGMSRHIYLGWPLLGLLALGTLAVVLQGIRGRISRTRVLVPALLLAVGIGGVMILSLGVNNPWGGLFWLRLCKALPPYGMIRQPPKAFIVLPTLAAVLLALTVPHLLALLRIERWRMASAAVLAIVLLADYGHRIDPTICRLHREQAAYRAIAEDARHTGRRAHLLALPIWPGDSHWTSLNQHYISLYRLRMINGYRPTRRQAYLNDVYLRFESFNKGGYTDAQLDWLIERGITYLVLHENAYPEKVSPFAVSHTLNALLAHPRIKLLAQSGPVWSFKTVDAPEGIAPNVPKWAFKFPARLWQGENSDDTHVVSVAEDGASGGAFGRASDADALLTTRPYPTCYVDGMRFLARIRGGGNVRAAVDVAGREPNEVAVTGEPDSWSWASVPIPRFDGYRRVRLVCRGAGTQPLDMDLVILAAGDWDPVLPEAGLEIPAPVFFHAGYTDLASGEVVLDPDTERDDVIFYGPKLPLAEGLYVIDIDFRSDAPDGTRLATLSSRYPQGACESIPVRAGEPARLYYHHRSNLRCGIDLKYTRKAELRIKSMTFRKITPRPYPDDGGRTTDDGRQMTDDR